jgi:hypothetical protein
LQKTLTTEVYRNQLPHRLPKMDVPGWNSLPTPHATPSCPPLWRSVPPSPTTEQSGLHRWSTMHTATPTMEVAVAAAPRGPAPPTNKQTLSNVAPPLRELSNLPIESKSMPLCHQVSTCTPEREDPTTTYTTHHDDLPPLDLLSTSTAHRACPTLWVSRPRSHHQIWSGYRPNTPH